MGTLQVAGVIVVIWAFTGINIVCGECTWPSDLQNSTWASSNETLGFRVSTMRGFTVTSFGQDVKAWTCINDTYATNGVIMFRSHPGLHALGHLWYIYICMELTRVTDDQYQYHLLGPPEDNLGGMRAHVNLADDKQINDVCDGADRSTTFVTLNKQSDTVTTTDAPTTLPRQPITARPTPRVGDVTPPSSTVKRSNTVALVIFALVAALALFVIIAIVVWIYLMRRKDSDKETTDYVSKVRLRNTESARQSPEPMTSGHASSRQSATKCGEYKRRNVGHSRGTPGEEEGRDGIVDVEQLLRSSGGSDTTSEQPKLVTKGHGEHNPGVEQEEGDVDADVTGANNGIDPKPLVEDISSKPSTESKNDQSVTENVSTEEPIPSTSKDVKSERLEDSVDKAKYDATVEEAVSDKTVGTAEMGKSRISLNTVVTISDIEMRKIQGGRDSVMSKADGNSEMGKSRISLGTVATISDIELKRTGDGES